MIVDNNITRGDFEKSLKLQGLEAFTEEQVSAWVSGTRELIEKSEREELSDIEKSSIEEFKVDVLSLKRITVVEDDLTKSTMFIRPEQVIWDVAEDGEILKARSGIYGNTPENRKLGRIGQKYGAVKGGENEKESRVWTKDQNAKVKENDKAFDEHLKKKNIDPYSKEASGEWKSAGFQDKQKEIFGKKDGGEEKMTPSFTNQEIKLIEMIEDGKSFNGKVYQTKKGPSIYVGNKSFVIKSENIHYFETLKETKNYNYSLGFAVDTNNKSEVARATNLGYDAIES